MAKSWDMIVAEVMALTVPEELVAESWRWYELESSESARGRQIREDLEAAIDSLGGLDEPLALQRLRGWCAHCRLAHDP